MIWLWIYLGLGVALTTYASVHEWDRHDWLELYDGTVNRLLLAVFWPFCIAYDAYTIQKNIKRSKERAAKKAARTEEWRRKTSLRQSTEISEGEPLDDLNKLVKKMTEEP